MKDLELIAELVTEFLTNYFLANPDATEWRGSAYRLLESLRHTDADDRMLRGARLEYVDQCLEQMTCQSIPGDRSKKIWIFERGDYAS